MCLPVYFPVYVYVYLHIYFVSYCTALSLFFCSQYPEWIGAHRDTLSDTDYKRYSEQLDVMRAVCAEFEKEQASDSQEEKQARFDKVMQLMHQVS